MKNNKKPTDSEKLSKIASKLVGIDVDQLTGAERQIMKLLDEYLMIDHNNVLRLKK